MLDNKARELLSPVLDRSAQLLYSAGLSAGLLTAVGWLLGLGSVVLICFHQWIPALIFWILNRLVDGLDGPLARISGPSDLGGFLDILADFSIYSGVVVALGLVVPSARTAALVLLFSYYLSGSAFLALSSLMEKRRIAASGPKSLHFVGGLAEGGETIVMYCLFLVFHRYLVLLIWAFSVMVIFTALQRVFYGVKALRSLAP